MHFPLTEDMLHNLDLKKEPNRELLDAFIQAVNSHYEVGLSGKYIPYLTVDIMKETYKRLYKEEPRKELLELLDITAVYMNDAWQQGIKDRGKAFDMPIEAIQIYPCFEECPPKAKKMERKGKYFEEHGDFQSVIILDEWNYLIDGYTSYLLAKKEGMSHIPIRYGKRQIIKAYHRPGGKLYEWELPPRLSDQVSVGDRVLVHIKDGVRLVTVAAVEPYRQKGDISHLRSVIRRK